MAATEAEEPARRRRHGADAAPSASAGRCVELSSQVSITTLASTASSHSRPSSQVDEDMARSDTVSRRRQRSILNQRQCCLCFGLDAPSLEFAVTGDVLPYSYSHYSTMVCQPLATSNDGGSGQHQQRTDTGEAVQVLEDTQVDPKQHTVLGLGLHFHSRYVELQFLEEYSRSHHWTIIAGYVIQALVAIIFYLITIILDYRSVHVYSTELAYQVLFQDDPQSKNLLKICFGVIAFSFIAIGVSSQMYIHFHYRRSRSRSQSQNRNRIQSFGECWSIIVAFTVYFLELIGTDAVIISFRHHDQLWPLRLLLWHMGLVMASVWFTATPFSLNVFALIGSSAVLYGLAVPVIMHTYRLLEAGNEAGGRAALGVSIFIICTPILSLLHVLILLSSFVAERNARRRFLQRLFISYQQAKIIREKTRCGKLQRSLLQKVLPNGIVDQLENKMSGKLTWKQLRTLAHSHDGVCVMFAEVSQFSEIAKTVKPSALIFFLNEVFQSFDDLCEQYSVYKIETVGECYVAAAGLASGEAQSDNTSADASDIVAFGKALIEASRKVMKPVVNRPTSMRVGVHSGPIMSGIVGTKNLRFCLFGDTMNTAARMVQTGVPDAIQASYVVADLVPSEKWQARGNLQIKGKGKMKTYVLHPKGI